MIGIIGDSLTWQGGKGPERIRAAFAAAGHDPTTVHIDAVTGRGIRGGIPVVQQWRDAGFLPDLWLIALGTNNLNATTKTLSGAIYDLVTAIDDVDSHARVTWVGVGIRVSDWRVTRVNAVLGQYAPDGFEFLDWDTAVHDIPDQTSLWLPTDAAGVHMTGDGYQVRNDYYAACVA